MVDGLGRQAQSSMAPYTLTIFDQIRNKKGINISESMETVALDCDTTSDNCYVTPTNGYLPSIESSERAAVDSVRSWFFGTLLVPGKVSWPRMVVFDQIFQEGQVDGLVLAEIDDQWVIFVIIVCECTRGKYAQSRSQLYDFRALRNALISSGGKDLCLDATNLFHKLKLFETSGFTCRLVVYGSDVSDFNREQARLDNIVLFEHDQCSYRSSFDYSRSNSKS